MKTQGTVKVWPGAYDGAFHFGTVAMRAQCDHEGHTDRHFTVDLVGYDGAWRHPEERASSTTRVALSVQRLSGTPSAFEYDAERIIGLRTGDTAAQNGRSPERYRISVVRGRGSVSVKWRLL